MRLYAEILSKILSNQEVNIVFPQFSFDIKDILELECYRALHRIKAVLEDDSLDDEHCFMKIEEIICIFERMGSDGGNRHDFG